MELLRKILAAVSCAAVLAAAGGIEAGDGSYEIEFVEERGSLKIVRGDASAEIYMLSRGEVLRAEEFSPEGFEGPGPWRGRLVSGEAAAEFVFREDGVVEMHPSDAADGAKIFSDLRYGLVPGVFYLPDVVYDLDAERESGRKYAPSENLAAGLIEGGGAILVCAWPGGGGSVQFVADDGAGRRGIRIETAGEPLYAGILCAPGIWHRKELSEEYLDRDIEIEWEKPFEARWKTELPIGDIIFSVFFGRGSNTQLRRPVGWYDHPVWFENGRPYLRLSRRVGVHPRGEALIYPLKRHELTPVEFMKRSSDETARIAAEAYSTIPRYCPDDHIGFHFCPGTVVLEETVYRAGAHNRNPEYLVDHINDRLKHVVYDQEAHSDFEALINRIKTLILRWKQEDEEKNGGARDFLDRVYGEAGKMMREYEQGIKRGTRESPEEHIAYMEGIRDRVVFLLERGYSGDEYFPEMAHLLREYRMLRGNRETLGEIFGHSMRRMYRETGYACGDSPGAVEYAEIIRRMVRNDLRAMPHGFLSRVDRQ